VHGPRGLTSYYRYPSEVWRIFHQRSGCTIVMDSAHTDMHTYGPNGNIPDDVWSLRRFAVVERTPRNPANPYGEVIMFWDAENWTPWMELASIITPSCGECSSTCRIGARTSNRGVRLTAARM
jgi:hypothetical protein